MLPKKKCRFSPCQVLLLMSKNLILKLQVEKKQTPVSFFMNAIAAWRRRQWERCRGREWGHQWWTCAGWRFSTTWPYRGGALHWCTASGCVPPIGDLYCRRWTVAPSSLAQAFEGLARWHQPSTLRFSHVSRRAVNFILHCGDSPSGQRNPKTNSTSWRFRCQIPNSAESARDGGDQRLYRLARLSCRKCGDQMLDVCFLMLRATAAKGCGLISIESDSLLRRWVSWGRRRGLLMSVVYCS